MAFETLALAVVLVFAANAFLYYRWKALKEIYDEKQQGSRMVFAREMLDTVYATPSHYRREASLVDEAKGIAAQLKRIADDDLVQLHQKLVSADQKLSA
ncbi:MAG: hypothetical protein QXR53_03390 [Candidatus Norongarragalinales archaeon]